MKTHKEFSAIQAETKQKIFVFPCPGQVEVQTSNENNSGIKLLIKHLNDKNCEMLEFRNLQFLNIDNFVKLRVHNNEQEGRVYFLSVVSFVNFMIFSKKNTFKNCHRCTYEGPSRNGKSG
jgi:hypothetical protein